MTQLDLDAIEARAKAATPGPWSDPYYDPAPGDEGWWIHNGKVGTAEFAIAVTFAGNRNGPYDARFIAAAREDVPALVQRVRELEAARAGIAEALDDRGYVIASRSALTELVAEVVDWRADRDAPATIGGEARWREAETAIICASLGLPIER